MKFKRIETWVFTLGVLMATSAQAGEFMRCSAPETQITVTREAQFAPGVVKLSINGKSEDASFTDYSEFNTLIVNGHRSQAELRILGKIPKNGTPVVGFLKPTGAEWNPIRLSCYVNL